MVDSDAGSLVTIHGLNMQSGFQGKNLTNWLFPVLSSRNSIISIFNMLCYHRCEYLLQEKGQEFVHQIQARFPRLFEQVCVKYCYHLF